MPRAPFQAPGAERVLARQPLCGALHPTAVGGGCGDAHRRARAVTSPPHHHHRPKHPAPLQECLDLVDQILHPDPGQRASLERILRHPWVTQCAPARAAPLLAPPPTAQDALAPFHPTPPPHPPPSPLEPEYEAAWQRLRAEQAALDERVERQAPDPQLVHSRSTRWAARRPCMHAPSSLHALAAAPAAAAAAHCVRPPCNPTPTVVCTSWCARRRSARTPLPRPTSTSAG